MPSLFLDAGVLLGAVLPRDPYHERSRRFLQRGIAAGSWSSVYTSDDVLVEAANFITRKVHRREALEALLRLAFGTEEAPPLVAEVLHVHSGRFAAALDLLRRHFDQGLSLTDCSTVACMREIGIRDLATFDGGFRGLVEVVEV